MHLVVAYYIILHIVYHLIIFILYLIFRYYYYYEGSLTMVSLGYIVYTNTRLRAVCDVYYNR